MSAPSSLLFSAAMEDPFADTMEMASPFSGHVDDFEIDIDIMDDQPGNADNDFDLQDASPAPATGEALPDADMMDDVPEVTVTDASQQETQPHVQSNGTFYPAQETYESEMVDEEYEEDGDAPTADAIADTEALPVETAPAEETAAELAEPSKSADDEPGATSQVNDSKTEEVGEQISSTAQEPEIQHEEPFSEPQVEEEEAENHNLEGQPDTQIDAAEAEHVEPNITSTEKEAESHYSSVHPDNIAEASEQDHQTDQPREPAPVPTEEKQASDAKDTSTFLHSVKVLYQESEISMFPPREGDSSETYLLQNEGLAYESVDHLFKECRAILGEHASTSDTLVFDIECLGVQLSEDNTFNPKVTLSQLVDVYVHLCRNEGAENPEPLYLTLTTRPNLFTEFSNLLNAAAEGKGIPEIHAWEEEYEHQDTENAEDSGHPLPSEQHVEKHEDEHDEHVHVDANVSSANVQQPDDENDGQYYEVEEEEEEEEEEEKVEALPNQTAPTNPELSGHDEHPQAEADTLENGAEEHESVPLEGHDNTQYDLERHSDSSETLTQAPLVQSEDQQPEDSESHQQVFDDVDHVKFEDYENEDLAFDEDTAENADQDNQENDEADEVSHLNASDHAEAGPHEDIRSNAAEVNNTEATGEEGDQENAATEGYEGYGGEEYYEDEEYYEEEHQDANDEPAIQSGQVDDEDTPVEPSETKPSSLDALGEDNGLLDDSLGATELQEPETEGNDKSTGLTAELPDDLLGLEEDIFADGEGIGDAAEAEYPSGDGQADVHENDIDEIDFDTFGETGENEVTTDGDAAKTPLQRQNSSTGKRSRDPEDEEFDTVEASTPDAKRTRSS